MSILRSTAKLLEANHLIESIRHLSNKSAYITKIHRKLYLKKYPTLLVQPDGSTYTIRHYEPRRIIKLPIDLSTLTEEERLAILESRKPKKKVHVEEDISDDFSSENYLKYIKKRA